MKSKLFSLYRSYSRFRDTKVQRILSQNIHNIAVPPPNIAMSEVDKFKGDLDRYKGLTVKSDQEPCPLDALDLRLETSLASWREQGVRAVWFLVNHDQADWVPVLVKHGFKFHNADPNRLAMMQWIGEMTVRLSFCQQLLIYFRSK